MTTPNIRPGNIVRVVIGDRAITGEVLRVINRPYDFTANNEACSPLWTRVCVDYWDLEYSVLSRETYGRWKQNVDGGFVELVAESKDHYYGKLNPYYIEK
jgi:hypothetical protein